MTYKPSQPYHKVFTINGDAGATNADSLPTATANRNGTDDGAFALTVANLATGVYAISGTVPSGYALADIVQIRVAATVSSVGYVTNVDSFPIDTKYLGNLNDIANPVTVAGISNLTTGAVVTGSTTTTVIVSGLPTGYNYVNQKIFNLTTVEQRYIASQSTSGSNYIFTIGTGSNDLGPFTAVAAGNIIAVV
jgi:hypothetical protein